MMSLWRRFRRLLPGIGLLVGVAIVARGISVASTHLSPLIVAIAFGALIANTIGIPTWAVEGVNQHKLLLEVGIVLLGVRLTIAELITTGPLVVGLAVVVVSVGVVFTEIITGQILDIEKRFRSLLAAGASICGVSAVLAVAGSIDVEESDMTYAVGIILLFDTITLIIYPVLGSFLHITGKQFGVWVGLSLFSTGPTAAVGFAMSETAGQWATITKLIRNSFIGILAIAYAVRYTATTSESTGVTGLWRRFPKFLIGFLVVVGIANVLVLDPTVVSAIDNTGDWLFALAFAGLGFDLDIRNLQSLGLKPVGLVVIHLITISALSLLAVYAFI